MSYPTAVNSQVTDSVTQANVKILGDVPAIGTGNLVLATSQALANAAHAATSGMAELGATSRTATAAAISSLLSATAAQQLDNQALDLNLRRIFA